MFLVYDPYCCLTYVSGPSKIKYSNKDPLDNDQLDAQIFNTFIAILYMYMFRAISCSSSGGQIVLTLR